MGDTRRAETETPDDGPRCPKCSGRMDRGRVCLIGGQLLAYAPSIAPLHTSAYPRSALACLDCGYLEMYVDPSEVRAAIAGVKHKPLA